jgi:hypothetical protein
VDAAERWRVLRLHVEDQIPLAVLARETGISARTLQRWHQLYINDDGHPLMMSGGVQDGALVFTGVNTFFDGRVGLHRMSWSPLPGGGLRQHRELSMDDGKTWETLIDARGRRVADGRRPGP